MGYGAITIIIMILIIMILLIKWIKIFATNTEVNKGQMEVKIKNKKVNNFGIIGKVFKCRIQIFENVCHQRLQEVTGGQ